MIEELVKIHDQFTIEVKTAFIANNPRGKNSFNLKAWIFVPSSLDINRHTYSKEVFYRDLKVNTRLTTPVYSLEEIVHSKKSPLVHLENAIDALSKSKHSSQDQYEYQIKMFNSILKSSLRETINDILELNDHIKITEEIEWFVALCKKISVKYRDLEVKVEKNKFNDLISELYLFGDEFLSFFIVMHCFKLINAFDAKNIKLESARNLLVGLIKSENNYKSEKGYLLVEKDSLDNNRHLIFRRGVLKKYIESELFLLTQKKEDAFILKQFIYSFAAGISMIFATVVAFSFQQKYGNFTMPFFTALVVGYMLKDRMKELGRYYFAHKFSDKYYDLKTELAINDESIGWCKDGVDFIPQEKIPQEVSKKRARSSLLELNNKYNKEEVILYRSMIKTDNDLINKSKHYKIEGINRIIRLNLKSFLQKMDNPEVPLYYINSENNDKVEVVNGGKVYFLNIILELDDNGKKEFHRYLIELNREGILSVKNLTNLDLNQYKKP